MNHLKKGLSAAALVGALALAGAACGTSTARSVELPTTTTPVNASVTAATTDTVTAIPTLTGQGTTVDLNAGTLKALTSLGVKVTTTGSATEDASVPSVTFPITSGYAEIHSDHSFKPGYVIGSIEHDGSGLTFSAGTKSLSVSNFVIDPGHSMLYATVGGKPDVPLLFLDGKDLQISEVGGTVHLDGTVVSLTSTAATALDSTFGTTAVKPGLVLGVAHIVAGGSANTYTYTAKGIAEIPRLTGQSTSVALDPTTAQALTALGVKLGISGSASLTASTSTVHFPITGGTAVIHADHSYKPGYVAGVLLHQGSGLTLTKGSTVVRLTNFIVNPGASVLTGTVNGKVGIPLFFLNGSHLQISEVGSTVHLDGTVVSLTSTGAAALNQAFGTSAFSSKIVIGVAHIIAAGD